MIRAAVLAVFFAGMTIPVAAEQSGDSEVDQAKALLRRSVELVKVDPEAAFKIFGSPGYSAYADPGRSIYVLCFIVAPGQPEDGQLEVGQNAGQQVKAFVDPDGKPFGRLMYEAALKPEGEIVELPPYKAPKPGADRTPVTKRTVVMGVYMPGSSQPLYGCATGIYLTR